jgi:hypothetical protein
MNYCLPKVLTGALLLLLLLLVLVSEELLLVLELELLLLVLPLSNVLDGDEVFELPELLLELLSVVKTFLIKLPTALPLLEVLLGVPKVLTGVVVLPAVLVLPNFGLVYVTESGDVVFGLYAPKFVFLGSEGFWVVPYFGFTYTGPLYPYG